MPLQLTVDPAEVERRRRLADLNRMSQMLQSGGSLQNTPTSPQLLPLPPPPPPLLRKQGEQKAPHMPLPPPPPPRRKVVEQKAPQQPTEREGEVAMLDEEHRRAYFKEKSNANWRLALKNANRRYNVCSSGNERAHVFWIIDGNDSIMRGVGHNSITYRCLTSAEGTPEHSLLLEGEKMVMQAFVDAKKLFPEDAKIRAKLPGGFFVSGLGDTTGMATGNPLGFGVNSSNTNELFLMLSDARKSGDCRQVRSQADWIKSAFAHEMTHEARGKLDDNVNGSLKLSTNEIPASANQFLAIWDKDQGFFDRRLNRLKASPQPIGRIHAELAGLKLVQNQLTENEEVHYKPRDFSTQELKRAIASVPEAKRESVLKGMVAENLKHPPQEYEKLVMDVYNTFPVEKQRAA